MTVFAQFRNPKLVNRLSKKIKKIVDPNRKYRFMHVCGTHENSITRYGLRSLLPENVEVIAGPGCPVCVCPPTDIDLAIQLALNHNVIVASFGDMLKVPADMSLNQARALGGDVRTVYSISDAAALAKRNKNREIVFFAVGFETTACTTAALIQAGVPDNFSIIAAHRIIPPAIKALFKTPGIDLNGYVLAGHVNTVMGYVEYEELASKYNYAMAVAGFEPVDILGAIISLIEQTNQKQYFVYNAYTRAVKREGNLAARKAIDTVFQTGDASWRGIGIIPDSGLFLKKEYIKHDAIKKFGIKPKQGLRDIMPGCSCHKIMLGMVKPTDCSLFGKSCVPENPYGPCMVSSEGTCSVWYKYRGLEI